MKKTHFAALAIILVLAVPLMVTKRATAPSPSTPEEQIEDTREFFFSLLSTKIDDYWHRGDWDSAVRLLRAQIELDPNWVDAYSSAAWLLWSKKQFGEAEKLLREGIANNPRDYHLYFELGRMYFNTAKPGSLYKKKPEEARRLYELTVPQLTLAVKYGAPVEVSRLLANTLHKLGRYAEERRVLERVLRDHPGDPVAARDLQRLKTPDK